MTITQDWAASTSIPLIWTSASDASYSFSKVHFSSPSDWKTLSPLQLSSSSIPLSENESIDVDDDDDDDDDDEVQDAAAAVVNASVYTPVYIKLTNTYPMMIVEINRMEMF